MNEVRPNLRKEPRDLWSLERMSAGIEPGELALKPRFGKDTVHRSWLYERFMSVVLIVLGLVGLGALFFSN